MRTRSEILTELLVLRVQNGEKEAFELLVTQWYQRLERRAYQLTKDIDAVRDISQDSWVAIIKGIRRLKDPSRFQNWVYQIVRNKCMDWIRKRKSERTFKEAYLANFDDRVEVQSNELIDSIRRLIGQLSNDYQTVLTLFYLGEMGVQEIARRLSIPEGTVKSRLYHARKMLKKALEG